MDGAAVGAERVEALGLLPADRLRGAGRVADREPQPGVAVALAPQLAGPDRVDAADALPVLELAQGDAYELDLGLGIGGRGAGLDFRGSELDRCVLERRSLVVGQGLDLRLTLHRDPR